MWCRGRSITARAKAAFKFARGELEQLQQLLGFSSTEDMWAAAAPLMLAVTRGATVAFCKHGVHAQGGLVETEAKAMLSHVATPVSF